MSLPSFSIRRPITISMFFVAVTLFGVISVAMLRQELFPPITYPKLTVVTQYANAAPEEIETLITKPIEEAVGSTPGLRSITSLSREGVSLVIAEFGWDQNMDFSALAVREKIDLIKARLPRDSEEPTVVKFNPFELPAMTLSVSSDSRSPVQLKRLATKWVKDEIEKINGVASASISGGADEEILVDVDQGRLKASSIGIVDVQRAITESNLNYPGGTIKENFYEYLVRTIGEFEHIDEINNISVGIEEHEELPPNKQPIDGKLIMLKDVAKVIRQMKEQTSFSRFNGRENLTVLVQKQAQANTILVAQDIKSKLKELKEQLPEDIRIDIIYDQSEFVKEAINGVSDSAVQGGVLAFFILYIFLKNFRSAALVVIVIPLTILATFTLMFFTKISLNVISLGGIALGVGMLVDNSVVVIENVFRHFSEISVGDIKKSTMRGTEEVVAPLLASTLTTVMVFLPMIFVTGIAGQIFKELAWVVVVTQLFSIFVSLTLLPMLIVYFGGYKLQNPEGEKPSRVSKILDLCATPLNMMEALYKKTLPRFLKRKAPGLITIVILFAVAMFAMVRYEKIVMPKVDQGQFMVSLQLPVGTRVERTNGVVRHLERHLLKIPEVEYVSTVVGSSKAESSKDMVQQLGSHQGQMVIVLKEKRNVSTDDLIQRIREAIHVPTFRRALRGAAINFISYDSAFKAGGEDTAPVVINVKGNNLEVMKSLIHKVQSKIEKIPGIVEVANTIPESAPETKIIVNKDKAAFYRISVTDLATAAHISIKGAIASKFKEEGKELDIRVVLQEKDRKGVSGLPFLLMYSPAGINVPLDEIVAFKSGFGPSEIRRETQERTMKVTAKVFGRSTAEINADIEKIIEEMDFPPGYLVDLAGESEEVQESFKSLQLALILSVVLVYMIMAAQFESYFQPFIIMFTMPLALIGVSLALGATHTPISVVVVLGIILLGGIVVNNGIILIDFVNGEVKEGKTIHEAVTASGLVRFRPIMMTAATTVLGLVPLALGIGEGAKLQAPMAIAVMGGMIIATTLTLLVIPAIYEATQTFKFNPKAWFSKKSPR